MPKERVQPKRPIVLGKERGASLKPSPAALSATMKQTSAKTANLVTSSDHSKNADKK